MAGRPKRPTEKLKLIQSGAVGPDELILALEDPSPLVVEAAAKHLSAPKAAPALLRAYLRLHEGGREADPGCWARIALIQALGRLEAPEGEEAARLAIRTVQVETVGFGPADTATGLRVAAASLYANLRARGALLDLAWLLHDFEPNCSCSRQERPFAKSAARAAPARAIGALGETAGAAVLAVKLAFPGEELPEVTVECMDALAALGEPRLPELLLPHLHGPDPYLSAGAATALATGCKGRTAVPLLVAALDRAPAAARESIVYALAAIRAGEAREALEALAETHPDPKVRQAAKDAAGT